MENENFAASKANEPLMSQNNQGPQTHQHSKMPVVVAVVEEDETKKKFLSTEGDGVHYKKEVGQVEFKQTPKFIGLTQEELQRYADDPFWRRLRIILFVLFWLSWILMFVIAIVLVVTSPKCPPKPQRHWWQKQLCYQAYTRTFKDASGDGVGDFKGMKEKINDISRLQVQTIWPVPVIKSSNFTGYDVTNFTAVDERLGSEDDFKALVDAAHDLKMYVVIDLPLTTMSKESEWFNQSSRRSGTLKYADFFYWLSTIPAGASDNEWPMDSTKSQHYRVDPRTGWPILNWTSWSLREEMKKVLRVWLDRGVDGFHLGHVQYMGLNAETGEIDWNTVEDHIRDLRTGIDKYKNETGRSGDIAFFTSVNKDTSEKVKNQVGLIGDDGLSYFLNTELTEVNDTCDSKCIRDLLVKAYDYHGQNNESWPVWEIGNPYIDRVATRFNGNRQKVELFQMLLFMLEGSINTYYGDELGLVNVDESKVNLPVLEKHKKNYVMRSPMQWTDEQNAGFSSSDALPIPVNSDFKENNLKTRMGESYSAAKLFKKMGEWRMNDESFLYAKMEIAPAHDSLVGIKRNPYASSPTYYAVMNFANQTLTDFNLKPALGIILPASAEPTVGIMTSNLAATGRYRNRDAIDIEKVTLEPYSGLVFKYK